MNYRAFVLMHNWVLHRVHEKQDIWNYTQNVFPFFLRATTTPSMKMVTRTTGVNGAITSMLANKENFCIRRGRRRCCPRHSEWKFGVMLEGYEIGSHVCTSTHRKQRVGRFFRFLLHNCSVGCILHFAKYALCLVNMITFGNSSMPCTCSKASRCIACIQNVKHIAIDTISPTWF